MRKKISIIACALVVVVIAVALIAVALNREEPVTESEAFFPMPETVVLLRDGEELELNAAQASQVYVAWMQLMEQPELVMAYRNLFQPSDVEAYLSTTPCIEFRFDQRYQFTGRVGGERYDTVIPSFTYDAILLVPQEGQVTPIAYCDGAYTGINGGHYTISCPPESYALFQGLIATLP